MTTSTPSTFRKSLSAICAAAVLATSFSVAAPATAEAKSFKRHHHGYHHRHHRHYGGHVAAGIIGGLAVGALAASAYPYYGRCYTVRERFVDHRGRVRVQHVNVCD